MSVEADGVHIPIEVDDKDFKAKFDELERRLEDFEKKAERKAKKKGMFNAGIAGAAAGFVAGAVMNNPVVGGAADLLVAVIAAGLLPVITALLPVIEALVPLMVKLGEVVGGVVDFLVDKVGAENLGIIAGSTYIGGKIGGPAGAAAGTAVGTAAVGGKEWYDWLGRMNQPLSQAEIQQAESRGGSVAQDGTRLVNGDGSTSTVNRNEQVYIPLGPIMVPVNRDRLWGPEIVI